MTEATDGYDVFISHASEDKQQLVRPLARLLQLFGLRVWFDEAVLEVGDSLSRSIDAGLARSRFGIVVISRSFITKKWPEYELRGLVSREVSANSEKVILPIWYDVSREEVLNFSPSLADKVALQYPNESLHRVAFSVLQAIDPERAKNLVRYLLWRKKIADTEPALTKISELAAGPIRHSELPQELVVRIRLVQLTFGDVAPMPLERAIENFKRDLNPGEEIAVWERMAVAFLRVTSTHNFDSDERHRLVRQLLALSFMSHEQLEHETKSDDEWRRSVAIEFALAGADPESMSPGETH